MDDRMTRANEYARVLADAAYSKAEAEGVTPMALYDAYHLTYLKALDEFYEQDAVDKTAAGLLKDRLHDEWGNNVMDVPPEEAP